MAKQNQRPDERRSPRVRRGAPAKGEASARERILATASRLFYREGVRAVGVDTIVAESGVSKTSLYRSFASKDDLIAAFAREQDRLLWVWWDRVVARYPGDPAAQLSGLLTGIAKLVTRPDFRGCPFINLATEFPSEGHPGHVLARRNKRELRQRLAALTAALGAPDPDRAAARIALIIDGAFASASLADKANLEADLKKAALAVIAR